MVAAKIRGAGWLTSAFFMFYGAGAWYPAHAQSVSGAGEVLPGAIQSPHWDVGGDLIVGDTLPGTLTINAGGSVSNTEAYIGNSDGGTGILTVTGRDGSGVASIWTSVGPVYIGGQAGSSGTLRILDGGVAHSELAVISSDPGSVGEVLVSGAGSSWDLSTTNALQIGALGKGSLHIEDGGAVRGGQALIGQGAGSEGSVTVSGPASVWNPFNNIYVGYEGAGDLGVLEGATVATVGSSAPGAAATIYIGNQTGSVGRVTVSSTTADVSTLSASDRIEIGSAGTGTLNIARGGLAVARSDTWLTVDSAATGTLNLTGDAGGRGVLETGSVIKGAGNATFNLDGGVLRARRDKANFLNGFLDQAIGSEGAWFDTNGYEVGVMTAFSGTSQLTKLGAGTLTLSGNSAAFTGTTDVHAGTLQVDGTLGGPVNVLAGARLTGTGYVGSTVNRGTIAPGPRSGFGILTVAGNYAAQGGNLEVRTQLGGDDSPTDRLVVTGDTSGATPVTVKNMGGAGGLTQRGIQIVQVNGVSAGQFNLANGDYVIEGRPALVAGAYGYVLQQDSVDGGWYLRSSLTNPGVTPTEPGTPPGGGGTPPGGGGLPPTDGGSPDPGQPLLYQPGVPVYEAYANTLLNLGRLPTLRQRVGNRLYDSADVGRNGVWSRIESTSSKLKPSLSTTSARQDIDGWKAQFGVDGVLAGQDQGASLVGGIALHYGKAGTDVDSMHGNGKIDTTAYGLMPTLTWYGSNGLYIDTQAQATWFDSDLDSHLAGRLKGGRRANSYGLGVETGRAFALNPRLALIPQAQVTYVSTRFAGFNDLFGVRVGSDRGESLLARIGLGLDYKRDGRMGSVSGESSIYGVVNVKHELLDGTRVRVADVLAASRMERTWAGVAAGANYGWGDHYAIYGQVDVDADFAGSSIITATAGFRMWF